MIKICSVVMGETLDEFLKNLTENQKVSNFIELRVDYIKNVSIDDIRIIKDNVKVENIFTCRSIKEGGKFDGDMNYLLKIIETANSLKFDHIDIESGLLDKINFTKNCKIIGSHHDFEKTPNYYDLLKIYDDIKKFAFVDIVKIATSVNNDEDNINLIKLLINKDDIIALGMGEKGKITRIVAPLLGGYLTFGTVNNNISASGQMSLDELKQIYGEKYDR